MTTQPRLKPTWGKIYRVTTRWIGIKREEFNKPPSHHPYIFLKRVLKVHGEPFQPGLNCLRAFFGFFFSTRVVM